MNRFLKWLKDNWLIVTVAILAIVLLLGQQALATSTYQKLFNDFNEQAEDYDQQIKDLEKIRQETQAQLEKNKIAFKIEVAKLKKKFENRLVVIETTTKKHRNQIVKKAKENPKTLTDEIERAFGIPVAR